MPPPMATIRRPNENQPSQISPTPPPNNNINNNHDDDNNDNDGDDGGDDDDLVASVPCRRVSRATAQLKKQKNKQGAWMCPTGAMLTRDSAAVPWCLSHRSRNIQ